MTKCACLACGAIIDAATCVYEDAKPTPGDITICIYCGHIMGFTDDMRVRELTGEEIVKVAGDARIVAVNRARAEIKNAIERHKKGCAEND